MNENLVTLKAAIVAGCTALGAFLGWKGIMALVWVAVMALDYISGTFAACKEGEWCSATARAGLWHKGGMILVVAVSAIADSIMEGRIPNQGGQNYGRPMCMLRRDHPRGAHGLPAV